MRQFSRFLALLGFVAIAFASANPRDDAISPINNVGMMCAEGDIKCLAGNNDGKDGGVFECVNGYWKLIQDCRPSERCVGTPSPHCTWGRRRRAEPQKPAADPAVVACKEGELKCLAANDKGMDGAVFQCTNGYWKVFQDCRSYERCVSKPTPHCTWGKHANAALN
ncbi:hypothetical protein EK21DRAFT_87529 [Setomelanomma holmii]|uniref:Uncharacterized protein n=1 Tax=Setomelanomma holmii TaxID=210430 RepID=A0A9P4HEH6_9PLEO|nr:hypothetical protein EK21DRAFT_87529 [Setomelanomma holmii]